MTMPFGKYAGEPLEALPDRYLTWAASINLEPDLEQAIVDELRERAVRRVIDALGHCPSLPSADLDLFHDFKKHARKAGVHPYMLRLLGRQITRLEEKKERLLAAHQ